MKSKHQEKQRQEVKEILRIKFRRVFDKWEPELTKGLSQDLIDDLIKSLEDDE